MAQERKQLHTLILRSMTDASFRVFSSCFSPHHGPVLSDWGLLFALTARMHPEVPTLSVAFVFFSFHRYVSVQTWTPTDGWSLEGSRGWFGSILSVDSPVHWATVCSLKAEPISVLCSSWPPPLQGLAFLQPAIAFCLVLSRGPHRTLGMKSAENSWLRAHSHRNWGLPGQWCCQAWIFRPASPGPLRFLSFHRLLSSWPPAGRGVLPPQTLKSQHKTMTHKKHSAWPRLGSQIAHIEHIVKWVKLSKGTGCFWDHMWVGVWRTGKGYLHEGSCLTIFWIQYYCLPNFLFRVPNTQAHKQVMVTHWTEAAYRTS